MRISVLLVLLCLGLCSFAQKPDARLSLKFSESQLNSMDQHRIAYWNYYLDYSFEIMDLPAQKATYLSDLEVIEIASTEFHGMSILLDEYQAEGAYLRFAGEEKLLVIKPMKQFIEEFNAYYQAKKG